MREKIVCLRMSSCLSKVLSDSCSGSTSQTLTCLQPQMHLWSQPWTFSLLGKHTLLRHTGWKKLAFRWFWKQYLTETINPVLCSIYQYTHVFNKHSWKIKRVVIWLYINLRLAVAARVMKHMCQALRLIYLLLICPERISGCCVSTCFHSATRIPILVRSMKPLCEIDLCIWLTIGAW
jgi:hypothetical protein